jgi:hypothetical protein
MTLELKTLLMFGWLLSDKEKMQIAEMEAVVAGSTGKSDCILI